MHEVVFLFDVDNTLLDNDAIQADLRQHIEDSFGTAARDRYWLLLEALRAELGYVDYLGALERYRLETIHDPQVLRVANWLVDYPFAARLYPRAAEVLRHSQRWGPAVILSDGDAVFQPRKVERSGLWSLVHDNVLIYVHKEEFLDDVERFFPARRYVMIDDKLRILEAIKRQWGAKVFTIFPRQGHYANDPAILAAHPPADLTIDRIGELAQMDFGALLAL